MASEEITPESIAGPPGQNPNTQAINARVTKMGETIVGHLKTLENRFDAMDIDKLESAFHSINAALAELMAGRSTVTPATAGNSRKWQNPNPTGSQTPVSVTSFPINSALASQAIVKSVAQPRDATDRLNLEQYYDGTPAPIYDLEIASAMTAKPDMAQVAPVDATRTTSSISDPRTVHEAQESGTGSVNCGSWEISYHGDSHCGVYFIGAQEKDNKRLSSGILGHWAKDCRSKVKWPEPPGQKVTRKGARYKDNGIKFAYKEILRIATEYGDGE